VNDFGINSGLPFVEGESSAFALDRLHPIAFSYGGRSGDRPYNVAIYSPSLRGFTEESNEIRLVAEAI